MKTCLFLDFKVSLILLGSAVVSSLEDHLAGEIHLCVDNKEEDEDMNEKENQCPLSGQNEIN